jgi:hypothetical protein
MYRRLRWSARGLVAVALLYLGSASCAVPDSTADEPGDVINPTADEPGVVTGAQASALTVQSWLEGWWDCLIDGRPSTMAWEYHDVDIGTSGSTSAVVSKLFGWFREANSPWVKLTMNSAGDRSTVSFIYTGDTTNWILEADSTKRSATGWTTWNGRHYPLSCQKR